VKKLLYTCVSLFLLSFLTSLSSDKSIAKSTSFHYELTPEQRLIKYYKNLKKNPPSVDDGQLHFALQEFSQFQKIVKRNKELKELVNNFEESLVNVKKRKKPAHKKKKHTSRRRVPEIQKKEADGLDYLLLADHLMQRKKNNGLIMLLKASEYIKNHPKPKTRNKKEKRKKKKNLKRRRKNQETPEEDYLDPEADFIPSSRKFTLLKVTSDYSLRPRTKKRKRK